MTVDAQRDLRGSRLGFLELNRRANQHAVALVRHAVGDGLRLTVLRYIWLSEVSCLLEHSLSMGVMGERSSENLTLSVDLDPRRSQLEAAGDGRVNGGHDESSLAPEVAGGPISAVDEPDLAFLTQSRVLNRCSTRWPSTPGDRRRSSECA